ncbi:ATP-binding protein [Deinococcus murrayi]|uniref:ATP-binding protein n=1 Tax=Deinococcus murrayi TaxID=68910 RepID=UPI00047F2CA9|nr:ATP-binding protein [Deinococcus murrayi]
MTAQPHEQTALAIAQRQLVQARENDRALHPKPQPASTLGDLLGRAERPAPRLPTAAHVRAIGRVRSMPRFMQAFHNAYCTGGVVVAQGKRGEFQEYRCPRCEQAGREARLRAQMEASGVEGRYLDVEWSDLELLAPLDRVATRCRDITALIDAGASLLLYGEGTGSGKTQAAMLCAKAAIRAGRTACVVNLARLALEVRESYRERSGEALTEKAALRRLTDCDLLVIDDLGAGESDTAAVERRLLFLALDERQMRRRPTIVTTNLLLAPPAEEGRRDPNRPASLVEVMGARVLARLQPLRTLHVNHGVNFRARKSEVSW